MFEEEIGGLDRVVAALNAASAEALREVADLDDARVWRYDGATSMTPWLAGRYGLTWATAREWVRVAHALRELPSIARAYRNGRLSWDQLRPLTKFAVAETDGRWAEEAPSCSAAWLWREAARHQRMREEEAEETHRRRYLSMDWNEDRTELYLSGRLGGEQGAAFEQAVSGRAEEVVLADDPFDPAEARQADALVELVTGAGQGDGAPATPVVVHADASVLTREESDRGPWLAEIESGERLSSEAIRRLACDARIEWILERDGRHVGIGRRGRVVPGAVGRALRYRDQSCRFPGCERTRWLKAHHLVHWARGGGTDLDNLVLLCHAHHRLIHEGGWRTSGHPAHDLRFHDPTGRPLRSLSDQSELVALSG